LTQAAIDQGLGTKGILDNGLIAGMAIVGEKFKTHVIFLPDVLLAAKAMYAGLDLLKPKMLAEDVPTIGKVVIGTVHGDLHDIGKNLAGIMLKGAGFDVIDLGKDVTAERFVDEAESHNADAIGMSALLTTTMPVMKDAIALLEERGLRQRVKVLVGGAPLSSEYAKEIGADAYCYDGMNAVERLKQFVGK
jgi:5-methyltetrahydrofolate--homocysteine methyltransferase